MTDTDRHHALDAVLDTATYRQIFTIHVPTLQFALGEDGVKIRLYWSKSEDCSIEIVSNSIRRNRFEEILRYLHLADNTRYDGQDRLYKVRPLFGVLNKNFFKKKKFPFKVKIFLLMYPSFRIMVAMVLSNLFMGNLLDSAGYLYHAEPYAGVDTDLPKTDLGQGGDWINVEYHQARRSFLTIFLRLKICLKNLPEEESVQWVQSKKTESDRSLLIMCWNDSNVITAMTNCFNHQMKTATRYCTVEKKKISVPIPRAMAEYNSHMGGVDLCDQFIATYRTNICSKKWWFTYFRWALDVSVSQGCFELKTLQ
ncbi:hypothetical protein J437_LFUL004358 [Ladona fulva]|uniref:PiggyBac transposable element-derived protein domain-containing protein n=1 Tax=Ladona fulva TaxID=123851 RepID=A0A8K0K5D4_LADFU|nr:hypothetical protein J437_LFUL004358 [Ladona fulva]